MQSGEKVLVERCSFLIDGDDVWEKYGKNPQLLPNINASMFKDKKGKFYHCDENYCKQI